MKPAMVETTSQVHEHEPIRIIRLPILTSLTDFQIHQWTRKELDAYLSPDLSSGSPPYTGVLFDAELTNQGAMISPWSMGFGRLASKADWLDVIRELFQSEKNVSALRKFSQLRQAGPIDVWIGLPYPFEQKSTFGTVGSCELDFSNNASARVNALSWWIDTLLTAWSEGNDTVSESAVKMRGFVWARGAFWGTDKETLRAVAQILHEHQLKLMRMVNQNADDAETRGLEADAAERDADNVQERAADVTVIRPCYRQSGSSVLYSRDKKVELVEAISPGRGEGES